MPTIFQPSKNGSHAIYRTVIENLDFASIYKVKISAKSNIQLSDEAHILRKHFFSEMKATTTPKRLVSPNVISTSHHTASIRWNPPTRIAHGSNISNYVISYERINP